MQAAKITLLASNAISLSTELRTLPSKCHHEKTTAAVSAIADELAQLSSTLLSLNDATNNDPIEYTDAFQDDLKEITTELETVLAEIAECCSKLQKVDGNVSSVAWSFKRGRVASLLQHLEALRGTSLVMRTVLWHGKDYGTHRSDRIAESNPHTMHEDRVILEAILAQNRGAILDLHSLVGSATSCQTVPTMQRKQSRAGDHQRQLSESTGVDTLSISDVLPPSKESVADQIHNSDTADSSENPRRTFSKRGVRLGVHMSILDLSAHEAPESLKRKWLQQAKNKDQLMNPDHPASICHYGGRLPTSPELSRIPEVDTNATSAAASCIASSDPQSSSEQPSVFNKSLDDLSTPIKELDGPPDTPSEIQSPFVDGGGFSNKLRKVINKLSMTNLRTSSQVHT